MRSSLYWTLMDQSKSRPTHSSTPDGAGDITARPVRRAVGSAHVIDLRQKPSSFEPAARAGGKTPAHRPKPPAHRHPKPATSASAAATQQHPQQPAPAARPPQKEPAAVLEDRSSAEGLADAAFPPKSRFWPAFWRFLLLLIVLGLIVILGIYLYVSYYHQ